MLEVSTGHHRAPYILYTLIYRCLLFLYTPFLLNSSLPYFQDSSIFFFSFTLLYILLLLQNSTCPLFALHSFIFFFSSYTPLCFPFPLYSFIFSFPFTLLYIFLLIFSFFFTLFHIFLSFKLLYYLLFLLHSFKFSFSFYTSLCPLFPVHPFIFSFPFTLLYMSSFFLHTPLQPSQLHAGRVEYTVRLKETSCILHALRIQCFMLKGQHTTRFMHMRKEYNMLHA